MKIRCVWEHNGDDSILWSANFVGAFTRGEDKNVAIGKMEQEVLSYLRWKNESVSESFEVEIVQEKDSELNICDADSDVLFKQEEEPLTLEEYRELKALALKSAEDFLYLYEAIPDKNKSSLPRRKTFYGDVPRTAFEMYEHTKNVNSYYFSEIGVGADNEGSILQCRENGFRLLEQKKDFLDSSVIEGSYEELWSLRKVLRRFIWHDRIHAKAMYRMAIATFGAEIIPNVFQFEL